MGIRTKTLGLIALLITLVWVVLLGVAVVFAGSIAGKAERVDAQLAVERADQGLVNDAEPLNVFVADWAEWDDTYNFIKGTNPDFQRSILTTDDLDAYNVDFIVVADNAGSIVGSVACDPTTRAKGPVPAGLVSYLRTKPPCCARERFATN